MKVINLTHETLKGLFNKKNEEKLNESWKSHCNQKGIKLYETNASPLNAAVCALFVRGNQGDLEILLTKRNHEMVVHAGQVCFPGGKQEDNESMVQCALRETQEEIGIPTEDIDVLCQSTSIMTATGFSVNVIFAYLKRTQIYNLAEKEVERIIQLPVDYILQPKSPFILENRHINNISRRFYSLNYLNDTVWGFTGSVLSLIREYILGSLSNE